MLFDLFGLMSVVNINLAVFNLLPVPPLDGFKIFGAALPGGLYYKIMNYERYIGIAFFGIIIFAGGFISVILDIVRIPFEFIIFKPIELLFGLIFGLLI